MKKKHPSAAHRRAPGRSADPAARAIQALRRGLSLIKAEGGAPDRVRRDQACEIVSRLAHVPVAMLVADNRGRYVDANEAAAFLTGYTRAELLRCSVWDLTPDAHRGRGQALWRVFLARERMAGWYPCEKRAAGS